MMQRVLGILLCAAVTLPAEEPAARNRLALRTPAIPDPARSNPVDSFVEAYARRQQITLPPPVSDAVFARRAWLDLWGVVPDPRSLQDFIDDKSPGKRERLVDALLGGRSHYAQKWISFWNDLLRNDEGVEYAGARQSITTWLRRSLEENLPYDRFVSALLNPSRSGDPAGFLIGVNWRGEVSASQTPPMQAAQNSAQVFMGVNLKCNSCHDSFISRWKLNDAYGLASFFSESELEMHRCDVAIGEVAQPKFLYPELGGIDKKAPLAERRAAVARLTTSAANGRFPRTLVNRFWKELLGRGIVEPVDEMDGQPWDADLLDWLAADFAAHGYDMQHLLRRIMTSNAYQAPAVRLTAKAATGYVFQGPLYRKITSEQFADSISAITGEWRILSSRAAREGVYARDWTFKSSPLATALGRPIRDQVVTERNSDATTLQLLELTNGSMLDNLLHRGAARMLGKLPPAAPNLFDSGVTGPKKVAVDVDITGVKRLFLLLTDTNSYDPARIVAGWMNAELIGPAGAVRLSDRKGSVPLRSGSLRVRGEEPADALIAPVPTRVVYDISGEGFTRFRAAVGVDQSSVQDDIGPRVRFFVFSQEPDPDQLVRVHPETPFPRAQIPKESEAVIAWLYRYALGRNAEASEIATARKFLAAGTEADAAVGGLQDLLWSLFMSPEFQFVR